MMLSWVYQGMNAQKAFSFKDFLPHEVNRKVSAVDEVIKSA